MKALAELWVQWGAARDVIGVIEREPDDPRRPFLTELCRLSAELESHLADKDLAEAVPVAGDLAQAMKRANERLLAPLVKKGRAFGQSRKTPNAISRLIDEALTELGADATRRQSGSG